MKKILFLVILFSSSFNIFSANIKDYKLLECELKPFKRKTKNPAPTKLASYPHMGVKETQSSTNWSGYVAANNLANPKKNSVSEIYGTWNVPTLSPTSTHTYSSIWVGIDGFTSSTVEQLGTEHDWVNGKQVNYAWFEMYPNYSYEISQFPVNPGDSISASVVYQGNNVFVLSILNNTKKVKSVIPTKYTTSKVAQRVCAEWVVEAPYENTILPLAHFSPVTFTNCKATINGVKHTINQTPGIQNTSLNMVGNSGLKALTSTLFSNGQSFNVTWKGQ